MAEPIANGAEGLSRMTPLRSAILLVAVLALGGCDSHGRRSSKKKRRRQPPAEAVQTGEMSAPVADPFAGTREYVRSLTGDYPHIQRSSATGVVDVSYDFTFEGASQHLRFTVERAVLDGARSAARHVSYPEGQRPSDLEARANLPYIVDPQQEAFFESALSQLRAIRAQLQLDDDRYFELLATFVQSIPYDEHGAAGGRFPVEVVVDRTGDCDEKTRLLAGLAAREGYGVALLSFDAEEHMAMGVRAAKLDYRGTGYAFVEATIVSLVTHPFADTSKVDLKSMPNVIPVADGTLQYRAADDIQYIVATRAELRARLTQEDGSLQAANLENERMYAELHRLSARIARLRASNPGGEKDAVREYDEKVAQIGQQVDAHNAAVERRNAHAELSNLYNDHTLSRATLARMLRADMEKNP